MSATELATILFTDLAASTEVVARIGEEKADEMRRRHFEALRSVVDSYDGREVKSLGDGLMLTFASPSHAVNCAVEMQQCVGRDRFEGERLRMKVGIALGEATSEDGDYFGVPVVEAARLCAAARPGQILVTDLVRALVVARTSHRLEPAGVMELKGLPDPVSVAEVVWASPTSFLFPLPSRLLAQEKVAMVGRQREREALASAWELVHDGTRHAFLVAGEPGIGKSRLMADIALTVGRDAGLVLAGWCEEELSLPYKPFVEALSHLLDALPDWELEQVVSQWGGELCRLVPELDRRVPGLAPVQVGDPETERYVLLRSVAGVLAATSMRHPILLLLEDLHWADKPTLLMLKYLLTSAEPMALLVVGTFRDTGLAGSPLGELLADLRLVAGVDRVTLRGLSDVETTALMEQVAGEYLQTGGRSFASTVFRQTDGHPFFIRELLTHLAESGVLTPEGGRWTVPVELATTSIPDSVREVVGRRLSRLSDQAGLVLSRAAVIGTQFDLAVLSALLDLDRLTILGALEHATSAALVREVPQVPGRYAFSHALIRHALYEQVGMARRLELHRAVALALESMPGGRAATYVDELAHHWLVATSSPLVDTEDAARATLHAERAGRRAMESLAYEVAAEHFSGAVRLAGMLDDPARRCQLLTALGEAQRCAGDPAHRETLLEAARTAIDIGEPGLAARAALANQRGMFIRIGDVDPERVAAMEDAISALGADEPSLRGRLLAALASEHHWEDLARRVELGREALACVRGLQEPECLAEVLTAVWFAVWGRASFAEHAAMADELAALLDDVVDRTVQFYGAMAVFLSASGRAEMQRADEALATCARIAEELGQPVLLWRVANLRLNRAFSGGEWNAIADLAAESARLGKAAGQPDAVPHARGPLVIMLVMLGRTDEALRVLEPLMREFPITTTYTSMLAWIYADQGRHEEALGLLQKVRGDGFGEIPRNYLRLVNLSLMARGCSRLGWWDGCKDLYDVLSPLASEMVMGHAGWLGPVAHDLATLARAMGRYRVAAAHFAEAVEVEQRIGARIALVVTRLEWARMAVELGDDAAARELLDAVEADARETGLERIQEIVEELRRSPG